MKSYLDSYELKAEIGQPDSVCFEPVYQTEECNYLRRNRFELCVYLLLPDNPIKSYGYSIPSITEHALYEMISRDGFFVGDGICTTYISVSEMYEMLRGKVFKRVIRARNLHRRIFK